MAHPGLESADINAMAQVLSGKRVATMPHSG
jgi:hypothetical protein